ncbi:hypothetical protein [Henriciella litoralis]|uniref:hypothetical protein n=1 Tax=Henriciella litoralis TaxID=568102 RepID=UPI00111C078C|nr:hypothetical protein [Henriciella litoralis]
MRGAIRTIIVAWAMLLGLCAISPALAQTARETDSGEPVSIEELVEDHTSNRRIQSERPEFKPDIPERQPRQRNGFLEAIAKFFAWVFQTFGGLLKILLISLIVAAVCYALWYMFGDVAALQLGRRKKDAGPDISVVEDDRPSAGEATALLERADALAAEGRFAEAVHLLLFRSIEDLRRSRSEGVPVSLTAREIQSLSDLSARARQALAPIIRIVENSFFGGRSVDKENWTTARASYEQFAFGEAKAA